MSKYFACKLCTTLKIVLSVLVLNNLLAHFTFTIVSLWFHSGVNQIFRFCLFEGKGSKVFQPGGGRPVTCGTYFHGGGRFRKLKQLGFSETVNLFKLPSFSGYHLYILRFSHFTYCFKLHKTFKCHIIA